jgi:hypothetical protein
MIKKQVQIRTFFPSIFGNLFVHISKVDSYQRGDDDSNGGPSGHEIRAGVGHVFPHNFIILIS